MQMGALIWRKEPPPPHWAVYAHTCISLADMYHSKCDWDEISSRSGHHLPTLILGQIRALIQPISENTKHYTYIYKI